MPVPRPKTRNTLAAKLKKLMELSGGMTQRELALASGISQTQIGNILRGKSACSVEVAEALARPFGWSGWQLISPDFAAESSHAGPLGKLIAIYNSGSEDLRKYLDSIVERERQLINRNGNGK